MAKYIFMVEYKYGNEGLMYKEGETDDGDYIGRVFYGGKGDIFVTSYERVCPGVNDFDIYSEEQLIMLEDLPKYTPKMTFTGTIKEFNDFMFKHKKELKLLL